MFCSLLSSCFFFFSSHHFSNFFSFPCFIFLFSVSPPPLSLFFLHPFLIFFTNYHRSLHSRLVLVILFYNSPQPSPYSLSFILLCPLLIRKFKNKTEQREAHCGRRGKKKKIIIRELHKEVKISGHFSAPTVDSVPTGRTVFIASGEYCCSIS